MMSTTAEEIPAGAPAEAGAPRVGTGYGLGSEEKRDLLAAIAEDKKAENVVTIPLKGVSLIADYFIICSGHSRVHIRAIADGMLEKMRELGIKGIRGEGYEQSTWILLDFGDVVVHVFSEEEREHFKLEELWQAERVPVSP